MYLRFTTEELNMHCQNTHKIRDINTDAKMCWRPLHIPEEGGGRGGEGENI